MQVTPLCYRSGQLTRCGVIKILHCLEPVADASIVNGVAPICDLGLTNAVEETIGVSFGELVMGVTAEVQHTLLHRVFTTRSASGVAGGSVAEALPCSQSAVPTGLVEAHTS